MSLLLRVQVIGDVTAFNEAVFGHSGRGASQVQPLETPITSPVSVREGRLTSGLVSGRWQ